MKYQFIERNKRDFDISIICPLLGVKRSSYYAWKRRPINVRQKENMKLLEEIRTIHKNSKGLYGSPRIYAELQDLGISCGKNRVAKLMKVNGIYSKIKKRFRYKSKQSNDIGICSNIVDRNFNILEPNKVWVSDITYIPTKEGWLYLCIILDLFSRKIVGWSMDKNMKEKIVLKAFQMALLNRNPSLDLVFHSDRGSQYTAKLFKEVLRTNKIRQSMSRKGNCWDNACAESFFHTLKTELVKHENYNSREEARLSVFEYIEIFYNRQRRHSYLGYVSPVKYENKLCA